MIGIIITLLYLHIVTLEIKVSNVNSQAFQECLEFVSSNYILSCSYLLIRLCPDNFCQHPDSESRVTSKLAVYTKLIPNLGNYPAILSLDDCTKTFFVSTNCQLGPWDLRRSLPPNLRHLKVSWFYWFSWFSRDATWHLQWFLVVRLPLTSQMASGLLKETKVWWKPIDVFAMYVYMCSSECSLARGQD